MYVIRLDILGAFAKLRKATICYVMSVRLCPWNNLATVEQIFMKFDIPGLKKIVENFQVLLESEISNGYCT